MSPLLANSRRQQAWGMGVAVDMFLTGTGAGTFLASFVLGNLGGQSALAISGAWLGCVLVMVGALLLFADLGVKSAAPRLFGNRSSWVARGALLIAAFLVLGLLYSLLASLSPNWHLSGAGRALGGLAALLSLVVTMYPGFLLGTVKGVPFWNAMSLPVLFLFSSLCTGLAVLFLVAVPFSASLGASGLHLLGLAGIVALSALLLLLGANLEAARTSNLSSAEAVRLLMTPTFVTWGVVAGLLVPLALTVAVVLLNDVALIGMLGGLAGILMLGGGLSLRHGILRAGTYVPLGARLLKSALS